MCFCLSIFDFDCEYGFSGCHLYHVCLLECLLAFCCLIEFHQTKIALLTIIPGLTIADSAPITTRQLESTIRLTEARARAELREEATEQVCVCVFESDRKVVQIQALET